MPKSTLSSMKSICGLFADCIKLGCTTANAGIRMTGEASAKARPHVQALTAKVGQFSLEKIQEQKEPEAQPTALIVAPAQQ